MDRRSFITHLSIAPLALVGREFPRYTLSPVLKEPLVIYTIPNCVWCDKLKKTLEDPAVQLVLSEYKVSFVEGPVRGIARYPYTRFKGYAFEGYKTPEALIAWIATVEHQVDGD